jgi:2'-deoxynucleoside 5'-phosphate N-hydrolase
MRIYFAASIAGGRSYLPAYRQIVAFLKERGHTVLTEHIVAADVLKEEQPFTAQQIYSRDIAWLESCDRVVAEISNPSLGVGYEICFALDCAKPVLCLHQRGLLVSRMITGIGRPGVVIAEYADEAEWREIISAFLGDA